MIRDPDLAPYPNVSDRRSPLDKARRIELLKYAKENGVQEILDAEKSNPGLMGAILMRRILRAKGLVNIKIPDRKLGQPDPQGPTIIGKPKHHLAQQSAVDDGPAMTAEDDLLRQFMAQQAAAVQQKAVPQTEKPIEQMTRAELAKTCKARGIKMARTDKKEALMERLRG